MHGTVKATVLILSSTEKHSGCSYEDYWRTRSFQNSSSLRGLCLRPSDSFRSGGLRLNSRRLSRPTLPTPCRSLPSLHPLGTLLIFEGPERLPVNCSPPPLPPPLPVGNQQTGRCEWTVKLYSAACRLPGGRYAITGRHAPVPTAPSKSAPVSLLLFTLSCCVQPVVTVVVIWCCEVRLDFKSLPPLTPPAPPRSRTWKGGASLPLPTSTRRGHIPIQPCQACGWAREGRDLESSVCTCTWAPHACLPAPGS